MKKILLLSTGGTIASAPTENGLAPAVSGREMVDLIPELADLCEIDCRALLNLDSTNIGPEEWVCMAEAVFAALPEYDGIVLTHGTDTMAYTAAALSLMVQHPNRPIVLTGSQIAIGEPNTDGKRNILDAMRVAVEGTPGICIVFNGRIIAGTHAKKLYTARLSAFHSVNLPQLGEVQEDGKILRNHTSAPVDAPVLDARLDTRVTLLKLLPSTEGSLIDLLADSGCRGLILEAFGCGGVPNTKRSLLPSIDRAVKKGVTVVIGTQCLYDGTDLSLYDVGIRAARLGVIEAQTMTSEFAAVKLMWVLGHTDDPAEAARMMQTDLVGELS